MITSNKLLFTFQKTTFFYISIIVLKLLASFWGITQFEALPGSWWGIFFNESGPYMLPVLFGVVLLIGYVLAISLLTLDHVTVTPLELCFLYFIIYVWLMVPISYLNGFTSARIWKDVAFASTYLLVFVTRRLSVKHVVNLIYLGLIFGFIAGGLALAEAVRRQIFIYHLGLSHFFFWTYRVFAGGHTGELLFAIGYLTVARGQKLKIQWPLLTLFLYFVLRFVLDFTRLNWLSVSVTLVLFMLFILPWRYWLFTIKYILIFLLITIAASIIVLLTTTNSLDFTTHPLYQRFSTLSINKPSSDISVNFRMVEMGLLLERFTEYPLTGWGPGGTISPNVPEEPARNNISVFFNGYPGLLYKFGLLGTIPLLIGIGLSLLEARFYLRSSAPSLYKAIMGGLSMLLLGIIIITFFTDALFANMGGMGVAILVGSIGRLYQEIKPTPTPHLREFHENNYSTQRRKALNSS